MMLAQADSFTQNFGIAALVLAAVTISLLVLRRRLSQGAPGPVRAGEHLERLREQARMRDTLDDLLLQLEEVNRRINAQLDTKFAKLETVIADADERIARLGQVAAQAASASPPAPRRTPPERMAEQPRPREATNPVGGLSRPAAGTGREDGTPSGEVAGGVARPTPLAISPHHQRVYDLRDGGRSPIDIAEELGVALGEVELILNLRAFR